MAIRYRKFEPAEYVMVVRGGRVVREGPGLAVLYSTKRTSLLAVPATVLDGDFVFDDILTADFQSCCVQGTVAYRFREFRQAADLLDFGFAERAAVQTQKRTEVLRSAGTRLQNLTKTALARHLGEMDIRTALRSGDSLGEGIRQTLAEHPMVRELGVEILGVTLVGISAKPETRRALEAASREQILREQDDAIYLRRNAAIEQERLVRENELNTEIRVAEKAREKTERELETARFVQAQELALEREKLEKTIELEDRSRALVAAQTANAASRARQQTEAAGAMLELYNALRPEVLEALAMSGMDAKALIARAFLEIGENAQRIGNLNVSPDLLEALTGK